MTKQLNSATGSESKENIAVKDDVVESTKEVS